jgi:xanthine dehydrogenase YagS FAD-binding subunit
LELQRPSSAEEAAAALGNGSVALAGGTELVPLMRDGLVHADRLVHLADAVPRGIYGTKIGAGTTLAELEAASEVPAALREACRLAASPQLRSMGTIGGNLLQATRCWYWRLDFPCRLHGGDRCHAASGVHREHAVFANDFCASAHPSDPAAGARCPRRDAAHELARAAGRGALPAADARGPADDDAGGRRANRELDVPAADASTYLKAMDRQRWSFPIVGVAAARVGGETRLALSGVAPIPWTIGSEADLDSATPLPGTAYKLDIARALVRRALAAVAG